ncbi:hypothetical protein H2202_007036 [Exophiala xenobiotica]|nr:hypothetical protein H2202_007036 [Exophiala xenobiotica]
MASEFQARLNLVPMAPKTRRSVACNHCRAKKIRYAFSETSDYVSEPRANQADPSISPSQPLIFIPEQSEGPTDTLQEECEPSIDVFDNQDVGQEDNSLYATDTLNLEYYAYFEEGLDRAFGVVERTLFDGRLRAHFNGTHNPVTDDKAWYALRNVALILMIMDDDEISCQVPLKAINGRSGDTFYCHTLIKMMQLASTAKKRLSSARALRQTTEQLIKTVRKLGKDLADFKSSVQQKIRLDGVLDASELPVGLSIREAQSLQAHYFCLVLDINTPLTYPWSGISNYLADNAAATCQVEASHIAFGYFSNLEFVTGLELSRVFVRDMCHFARLAVEHKEEPQDYLVGQMDNAGRGGDQTFLNANSIMESMDFDDISTLPFYESDFFGSLPTEDLESWSTLIPFEESDGMMF